MDRKSDFDKQRSDERVEFITTGQLDTGGRKYRCIVDNISTVGAAVEVESADPPHLQVGELVTLHVLLLAPVEYRCRVARIDTTQIGLQFVDT